MKRPEIIQPFVRLSLAFGTAGLLFEIVLPRYIPDINGNDTMRGMVALGAAITLYYIYGFGARKVNALLDKVVE